MKTIQQIKTSTQARAAYGITTTAFFGVFGRGKFGNPGDPIRSAVGMPKFEGLSLVPTKTGRWRYVVAEVPAETVAEFRAPILAKLRGLGLFAPVDKIAPAAPVYYTVPTAKRRRVTPKLGQLAQLALF